MSFIHGRSPRKNVRSSNSKTVAGGTNVVMRLRRSWDVKMPPPIKCVINKRLVYTGVGHVNPIQRSRKIVIEIVGPNINNEESEDSTYVTDLKKATLATHKLSIKTARKFEQIAENPLASTNRDISLNT